MNLGDAFAVLATSGCKIIPNDTGGIDLDVPPSAGPLPAELMNVLAAHRDELVAIYGNPPASDQANDLAGYLHEQGIAATAARLVTDAVQTFAVPTQNVTIEGGQLPEPEFFESGIPFVTTATTHWHEPARGNYEIPAGTLGLGINQIWAIADPVARAAIEAIRESHKRRKLPPAIPVWLESRARVLAPELLNFDATATPGMDLLPWRKPPEEYSNAIA